MNFKSLPIFVNAHGWSLFIFYDLFDSHVPTCKTKHNQFLKMKMHQRKERRGNKNGIKKWKVKLKLKLKSRIENNLVEQKTIELARGEA